MKITDNIINIGLLGTAGKELQNSDMPVFMQTSTEKVKASQKDTEDGFFKMAAMTFACYRSGIEAGHSEDSPIAEAMPEEKPYLPDSKARLLFNLLQNGNINLLIYGYKLFAQSGQIIPPFYLPEMLKHAFEQSNPNAYREKKQLSSLIGNRGNWYLQLYGLQCLDEEKELPWDTSTHAQRKGLLRDMRMRDSQKALKMLQDEWKSESATHRFELLQCLEVNLSAADEPFLTEVRTKDRSDSVKNEALDLLKRLPDSEVIRFYAETLKPHLHYRKLLGWSIDKITYSEELKKNGIEEVSREKGEPDSDYILRQLAENVPLSFWCELFDCDATKAAERLRDNPPFKNHIDFSRPILKFKDKNWAFIFTQKAERINFNLIPMLTSAQREQLTFDVKQEESVVSKSWFDASGELWGEKFSMRVLDLIFNVKYFYQNNEIAELLALYMPQSMKHRLISMEQQFRDDNGRSEYARKIRQYIEIKNDIEK